MATDVMDRQPDRERAQLAAVTRILDEGLLPQGQSTKGELAVQGAAFGLYATLIAHLYSPWPDESVRRF